MSRPKTPPSPRDIDDEDVPTPRDPSGRPLLGLVVVSDDDADVLPATLESARPFVDRWLVVDLASDPHAGPRAKAAMGELAGSCEAPPLLSQVDDDRDSPVFVLWLWPDEVLEGGAALRSFLLREASAGAAREPAFDVEVAAPVAHRERRLFRTSGAIGEPLLGMREIAARIVAGELAPITVPARSASVVPGVRVRHRENLTSVTRQKKRKRRDLAILERVVGADESDRDALLELGRAQLKAGHFELAIGTLERRVRAGGSSAQMFDAKLLVARAAHAAHERWPDVLDRYLEAYQLAPERPEPFYEVALHYAEQRADALAHFFAKRAHQLQRALGSKDGLKKSDRNRLAELVKRLKPME